ncbi:MAG: gas vesicle protein GvpO [Candidatus Kuenenbacteria bacterium]
MEPKELIEKAKKQLADLTGFKEPAGIGFKKEGQGCLIIVEIVEKESIPRGMDILGIYNVHLDAKGGLVSYDRKELRKRTDTEVGSGEE